MRGVVVTVAVSLLGPIEVDVGSGPSPVAGVKLQALLALLALAVPHPVSDDRLVDELWGDDQPGNPANALQAQVSQLRRLFGRETVVRAVSGYVLAVDPDGVDAVRLEGLIRSGRNAAEVADHAAAARSFAAAVALVRGPPLAGLLDHPFAREAAPRLNELVVAAHEGYIDAELASGHHAAVTVQLAGLVSAHPLWERFHAQLIVALFRCGRQSDALRAYQRARTVLAEEMGLEPGPELRALERAVLAHDPALVAPVALASITNQPALPVPLTSFVGRAVELDALLTATMTSRLVTVVGPAGAGKTRLALHYAGRVAADCEVRLVELALVADRANVDEVVAAAVGAPDHAPPGAGRAPVEAAVRVVERIAGRSVVVVVDNCEHVLDAVAAMADRMLADCPRVRIVATSREPLGLEGEQQLALGSLSDDEAVALFTVRARAVQPRFAGEPADLVELCRRLDGLPLAIELAAARSKSMPVAEITARLDDRFGLLTAPRPAGTDRQRTLRSAIDWSYDLLFEREQRAFRQLAVFAGGFTTDAAETVCGSDALDDLTRLVDKSLLVADTSGPTARFRMLQSLRDYGLDRLADTGELEAARLAYIRWCIALAEDAEAGIRTPDQLRWLDRLDAEHDNLQAALNLAALDDPDAGLRLIGALILPWWFRSRGREARQWVDTFLAAAVTAPPVALGKALTWSGLLADFGGGSSHPGGFEQELELADRRQQQAVAIGLELGDELAVAYARSQRGLTLTRRALAGIAVDRTEVAELIESALSTFAAHGDHFGAGETRTMQAVGLLVGGDLDGCVHAADLARGHAAHSGDRFVQGRVEWIEGLVDESAGDIDGAYRHIERGLLLLDELGMGQEVTAQAGRLITLAERRGNDQLAAQWREFVAGRTGGLTRHDVLLQASARNVEAHNARLAGDLDRARDAHQAALAGYRQAGVLRSIAFTESSLGFLASEMHDPAGATVHHTEALRVAVRAADPGALALSLEGIAAGSGDGQAEWAATLLGAAARWWTESEAEPPHRADVAATAERARRGLGDTGFADAHARGGQLNRSAAVDLARTPPAATAPTRSP